MSDKKRRDNKGRILQNGETQRSDGRYAYKYVDAFGKPRFVYSWKLTSTDRVPKGKRDDIPLREKEKQIQKDIEDGMDLAGGKMTVCQLFKKYTHSRGNVKYSTVKSRDVLMKRLEDDVIGSAPIDSIKPSDAREWAVRMSGKGLSFSSINSDKRSLCAAFHLAVQDDCIRKNPFDFQLSSVVADNTKSRVPLAPEQKKSLLEFLQNDETYHKYYDDFIILLGTGLRISEYCGLTVSDVDMGNRKITVSHQLLKQAGRGIYVDEPKTQSGRREIPMNPDVYAAFSRILERHRDTGVAIDGYGNFLSCTDAGRPKTACNYEDVFRRLAVKYNGCHEEPLPQIFTPHVLRHTFCTDMANAGMNPKALQYLMGHANIAITLNHYAHASFASAREEMERLMA